MNVYQKWDRFRYPSFFAINTSFFVVERNRGQPSLVTFYDENERQQSKKKQFRFFTQDLSGDFEEFKGRMDTFIQKVTKLIK
ncbi:hypothetical protein CVT91_08925 [Candidatus Atribacteria bacterium HGW-Atribacteria-1]|nr:MAG: hypothetical protein CVT91_08925 [Candidatus Atribacteria bacterium HGW-Atribacteria-1]